MIYNLSMSHRIESMWGKKLTTYNADVIACLSINVYWSCSRAQQLVFFRLVLLI